MGFASILWESPYGKQPSELEYPSFFGDLNIDRIAEKMLAKWQDYPLLKYFYYPATTAEGTAYRREVYQELQEPRLQAAVMDFSKAMRQARKFLAYRAELLRLMEYQDNRKNLTAISSRTANKIKYQHLLYDGAKCYVAAVGQLLRELGEHPLKSRGMSEFWRFLAEYGRSGSFVRLKEDVEQLAQELGKLSFQIQLDQNKLTVLENYDGTDIRESLMQQCGFREDTKKTMQSPFSNLLEIKEFEGLLLSMLRRPRKEVFEKLEEFAQTHEGFLKPELAQFEEEVQMYLLAGNFFREMGEYGFSFSFAEECTGQGLLLQDNYDVALACKHCFSPEQVVANDCSLDGENRFFVVTGPNQGGKTTFARAVGQAVYMNQMGFPVAGTKAVLPVVSVLFTHFPAEEEQEGGAGKLKEELNRLEPMIHAHKKGGFVIFNELFTTATTYDARIMGSRVIREFLDDSFYGIYVTHMKELADCDTRVVSMVAQVQEGDKRRRTYRIRRAKAQGIAYAQTIADRYRLGCQDILDRVSGRIPT